MFEPQSTARIFGLPLGVDFPRALLHGLLARIQHKPPEALAKVEIYVNTRRMQRRLKSLFDYGQARLLPRIRLVTDLARDTRFSDIPPPTSALRRRLELTQLIGKLLEQQPNLAPRTALFDLSDSLAALMDEMQGEGVPPDVIRSLDVSDVSGHWQRSLQFVELVERYFGVESEQAPDAEARQRLVIERLCDIWQTCPPENPILVAGSTGSRGATSLFMQAVAKLPQGAVILPGVDFDLPAPVWDSLDNAISSEDHPQYRFAHFARQLGLHPRDISNWAADLDPANPSRNQLISLAMRPAPVTDQWLTDGKALRDLSQATKQMTLIEAPSGRNEATAIALMLRAAAEEGRSAALITPDRTLTRQVTAALDRWNIIPDDSAGRPLPLSPPGRFLRHVASLFGQKLTSETLLTLLKHPLTNTGTGDRGAHLLHTREFELWLRRYGPPFLTGQDVILWAVKGDAAQQNWAAWISDLVSGLADVSSRSLSAHLDHHIQTAEALAAGPDGVESGELWLEAAGREAQRWVEELRSEAHHGGMLTSGDFASLFHAILQRGEVREATTAHPGIMIWGTLEARVQGADLVILAGLNEGVWPEPPKSDPWLNRTLRDRAKLLLPERQIGLSAHDFQQAIAAKTVVLSRAIRDAEAQTVPSRWLNRLTNLLGGLSEESKLALKAMRARGAYWHRMALRLDAPNVAIPPESRPSPCPPVDIRPREITVTEVQTLIRDPYAIYARRILGLNPLDPLRKLPDAPSRGIAMHSIVEQFIASGKVDDAKTANSRLMEIADRVFQRDAGWPAACRIWRARLDRIAHWLIEGEIERQRGGRPIALEQKGRLHLSQVNVTLRGKIDRVDLLSDGSLAIYDYKTGAPPSRDQQIHFDKQLLLSAILAESGNIDNLPKAAVSDVAYVGLGTTPKIVSNTLEYDQTTQVLQEFLALISAYQTADRGYTSRRAVALRGFGGSYDHLARYGEWDDSDEPVLSKVGP